MEVKGPLLLLSYYYRSAQQGEWQYIKEQVPLVWTPCNYGGKRPWFICPGGGKSWQCGRRVAFLCFAEGYFRCRRCHDLTYSSHNKSKLDRMYRKARKIRRRLGADMSLLSPIAWKPKGMHRKTFDRLRKEEEKLSDSITRMLGTRLPSMKSFRD